MQIPVKRQMHANFAIVSVSARMQLLLLLLRWPMWNWARRAASLSLCEHVGSGHAVTDGNAHWQAGRQAAASERREQAGIVHELVQGRGLTRLGWRRRQARLCTVGGLNECRPFWPNQFGAIHHPFSLTLGGTLLCTHWSPNRTNEIHSIGWRKRHTRSRFLLLCKQGSWTAPSVCVCLVALRWRVALVIFLQFKNTHANVSERVQ